MSIKLIDFVDNALAQKNGGFASAHFDELAIEFDFHSRGLQLLTFSFDLLKATSSHIHTNHLGNRKISIFVYLPLSCADKLKLWNSVEVDNLIVLNEPPSLYIYFGCDHIPLENEEYRYPILLENNHSDKVKCIYRCFRTPEGIENSWEFERGIEILETLN